MVDQFYDLQKSAALIPNLPGRVMLAITVKVISRQVMNVNAFLAKSLKFYSFICQWIIMMCPVLHLFNLCLKEFSTFIAFFCGFDVF